MAASQLKGLIIRCGHRVVFVRRTRYAFGKQRIVKKRRRPQPHRCLV